mmetsp:Transcript_20544/g.71094  ORF Transcript_20544/g.71094 Transcript_20544/m.71094 type:complete len:309 (-) Transcript_20544:61-987(-)
MATLSMRTHRPNPTLVLILAAHLIRSGVVAAGETEQRFAQEGEKCNDNLSPEYAVLCEGDMECRTRLFGGWGVCARVESDAGPPPMMYNFPDVVWHLRCDVAWCSHFTKYALPYSVEFGTSEYQWVADFVEGTAKELGAAVVLGKPYLRVNQTDVWEAGYFSANRFTPNPMNSTLCSCEYLSRDGPGSPIRNTDYQIAQVPNSAHRPFADVCAPFLRACPVDNRTAVELFDVALTEMYTNCLPLTEEVFIARTSGGSAPLKAAQSPLWAYVSNALAIIGFSFFALGLAFGVWGVVAEDDDQDGYLSIE